MGSVVSVARQDDIQAAVDEALGRVALDEIVRGRAVAVKPNDTSATSDDATGVTQPETLRAVLQAVKRHAPRALVVTGGSGAGETDEIFDITGLTDVVRDEGAEFVDHNRPPFETVELPYDPDQDVTGPQADVVVNPRVLFYETLISLAQLKVHRVATVTLTLKNMAMSYPAADHYGHPRWRQDHGHRFFDDMHSFIASMASRFPIDLGLIVGHPAMIGTGPLGGFPVQTGLVIASRDPLAADIVGAGILGFDVQAVRHLWEAARLGVGESDIRQFEFPGLSLEESIEEFSKRAYGIAIRP
jgi:uncharacterized protein (DUF362 family)